MSALSDTDRLLATLNGARECALQAREVLALLEALLALQVFLARLPQRRRDEYPYGPGTVRDLENKLLSLYPELRPVLRPAGPTELRKHRRR